MANRWGNNGNSDRLDFLRFQNHCRWWLQPWNKKMLALWKKRYDKLRHHIKKQRHYFANKGPPSQGYGFSSGHVCMWELDYKEGWTLKNWCLRTVVLEKTFESPLDSKEIKPIYPKGNQPWVFIEKTDAEVGAPILWSSDAKNWLTGKYLDAGKDWGHEEKGTTDNEMVGWHYRFKGHEFEQTLGDSEWQGSLACCSPWAYKELAWLSTWIMTIGRYFERARVNIQNWMSKAFVTMDSAFVIYSERGRVLLCF